ncbi:hypothetical protein N665_0619s0010 [Sinapis alba]|nr:hypothetical protein N665_0619s0010 [Sinapis alba]
MFRDLFFKSLAVTASSFQIQSQITTVSEEPASKSNTDVRQISSLISEFFLTSLRSRENNSNDRQSSLNHGSESSDFISTMETSPHNPLRESSTRFSFTLFKEGGNAISTSSRERRFPDQISLARKRDVFHTAPPQYTPQYLLHQLRLELFNQSQRFADPKRAANIFSINWRALEIKVHHFHNRILDDIENQNPVTNMARQFDRPVPKRNSALNLDLIVIDAFDNSDLLAAYDLTLVGRVLNPDLQAHRVKALLTLMPQAWQLEGRVQGVEVGRGKFHFRFNTEEELHGVLEKRPFFFDQWMFPLERWVPSVRTDFPSTMIFTVFIEGIPEHYHKEQTVKGIGEKLGELISWDVKQAKIRVSVECEKPLQFERRVRFSETGDEVVVFFKYDKLQKWCFICGRMSHDGKRCPDLEKERIHVSKHGYKDRNLRQQDVLRGELSPYNGYEKAPKVANMVKLPVNRKLFSEKETSPKGKQGGSSDKIASETTKAWVVKSFAAKNPKNSKVPEGIPSREKADNPKTKNFKQASWYREPTAEPTKAVSDPGKVPNRTLLASSKHIPFLAAQEKENSSVCSQMLTNPTDVEEVISPLKDLMKNKNKYDKGDERGGRRGLTSKSRLGPKVDEALHVKKKIVRSPFCPNNTRKRQAISHEESPKKRAYEIPNKHEHGTIPLPPTVDPMVGKKKEESDIRVYTLTN